MASTSKIVATQIWFGAHWENIRPAKARIPPRSPMTDMSQPFTIDASPRCGGL